MASAIGLRGYLISAHKKGDSALLAFDASAFTQSPPQFLTAFVARHNTAVQNSDMERSWYFEQKVDGGIGNSSGYIHYGTFGFESNFVNGTTKVQNYRRKVDDVEEIPLFYEMWSPPKSKFAFIILQSFAGRSCINLVLAKLQEAFAAKNPDYALYVRKLLPNDAKGSLYATAPVKKLRLIKRNASSDITDQYLGKKAPDSVNFEVLLSARRKKNLGTFGDISGSLTNKASGVVIHDGIEFSEAIAEIEIGGRTRKVGVFGSNIEAGVIDVTDAITKGPDGHPTLASLQEQAGVILKDFHKIVSGARP